MSKCEFLTESNNAGKPSFVCTAFGSKPIDIVQTVTWDETWLTEMCLKNPQFCVYYRKKHGLSPSQPAVVLNQGGEKVATTYYYEYYEKETKDSPI